MFLSRLSKLAQALGQSSAGEPPPVGSVGGDVPLGEDFTVGELVLEQMIAEHGRENAGETFNRCERVLQWLAPGEDGLSPWRPVVLRTSGCLALTAPGRAVYVSEGLLQMIGDDDAPLALVLAHEIAHHTLGHVASGTRWREWLGEAAGLPILAQAQINRLLFSQTQELAADREALAHCHRTGIDLDRSLVLFDVLTSWEEGGRELGARAAPEWMEGDTPFRSWIRGRWTGYPSLAVRREAAAVEIILLRA